MSDAVTQYSILFFVFVEMRLENCVDLSKYETPDSECPNVEVPSENGIRSSNVVELEASCAVSIVPPSPSDVAAGKTFL